jgi:hypothetical protein
MPVSDHLAFPLLRAFGQLEYKLKQRSGFLRADRYGNAMVDWRAVNVAIAALPAGSLQARLSERTLDKMLGGARNRPKVQVVEEVHGQPAAHFVVQDLDRDDARALVEAAKRVRNNLFHGGKEDPGEQPFDGDDDQWAEAALDVSQTLLDLVDRGVFGPAGR